MTTTNDKACWCTYCGHPVAAEGVTLPRSEDYDRTEQDRERCSDSACVSRDVAGDW